MNKSNQMTAFVSEIFSSAQGEGVHIGRRQLFVRFGGCHRHCLYCDTVVELTKTISIEQEPGSGQFVTEPNPVSCTRLMELVTTMNRPEFMHDDLFLTGGEPLLHADFLTGFLPQAKKAFGLPIHLETSGDLPGPFSKVTEWVDHVLMDFKLPSVTGEPPAWDKHRKFLALIEESQIGATLKLVVGADTNSRDLEHAAKIIAESGTGSAVVLQPMTAASKTDRVPTAQQVLTWQAQMAKQLGRGVRIIPQSHKLMGLL